MSVIRPVDLADATALTALVARETERDAYGDGARYFVQQAIATVGGETACLVAECDGELTGCVVYGHVAGTIGTARLSYVVVVERERRRGVGSLLCHAALDALTRAGMRRVVIEMADDPSLVAARALSRACGFAEAARVPGYYRDGVDLLILESGS